MSPRANTRVAGHGLQWEGRYRFRLEEVSFDGSYGVRDDEQAECECGALSPRGLTVNARQRWHRTHKLRVLQGLES